MEDTDGVGLDVKDIGTGRLKHAGVGGIFKVVVQAVLLFGSETWVMNPARAGPWGGFVIGCLDGSRDGNHIVFLTEVGSKPTWRRIYGRQVWRRWIRTSLEGRIRP